jgi:hypothetical protein
MWGIANIDITIWTFPEKIIPRLMHFPASAHPAILHINFLASFCRMASRMRTDIPGGQCAGSGGKKFQRGLHDSDH